MADRAAALMLSGRPRKTDDADTLTEAMPGDASSAGKAALQQPDSDSPVMPEALTEAMPADLLSHMFETLPLHTLGVATSVSQRWRDACASTATPLWKSQAVNLGYLWGWSEHAAQVRAACVGGWKGYVQRERLLEQLWCQPQGSALRARVLVAGHKHWVPSILMDAKSRELVTCSYDGTIRFWSDADAARPACFSVLTAGPNEGFSCIHAMPHPRGSVMLAAGSELGHVHIWEVWRPEDSADAKAARLQSEVSSRAAKQNADFLPLQTLPQPSVEQGPWSASVAIAAVDAAAGIGGQQAVESDDEGLVNDGWGAGSDMSFDEVNGEDDDDHDDDQDDDHYDDHGDEEMTAWQEGMRQGFPMSPRPQFACKIACWCSAHDFVQSILMLPGAVVVSGGDSGFVRLHKLGSESGQLPISLQGHSGAVMCLDAPRPEDGTSDATSSTIFSGSVDHTVGKWDLCAGVRTATLEGHTRSVHCLALAHGSGAAAGSNLLMTGSRDHTIKVWDLRTHACEHTLVGHSGSVTCIGSHGWRLVSGGGYNRGVDDDEVLSVDTSLKLWDLRKLSSSATYAPVWSRQAPSPAEPPQVFGQQPPGDPVLSLQLHESKLLTSHGGKQWTARIWDLDEL
uniref:F-box domain-containing protein n=1 Tax=Haptolina brevifila TaxID=156173 RepID=A0A7S2HKM1_9EUKA